MAGSLRGVKLLLLIGAVLLLALLLAAAFFYRGDILQTTLDPKIPFQTYQPPTAPNYLDPKAWALLPKSAGQSGAYEGPADVFFVHPTTYDGGKDWNAPIGDNKAAADLDRVMLPNYAGPFLTAGRVFAPRYRQASLYSQLTLREDPRDARAFAYRDVLSAWRVFLERYNQGRPIVIVGVEQGGLLVSRLLAEEIGPNPALRERLAGAYMIETVVPASGYGPQAVLPACTARAQARCVVAWTVARGPLQQQLDRSLVWDRNQLVVMNEDLALCVNPLTGTLNGVATSRSNLGAVNATGVEWGTRPAFLKHQVDARCDPSGLLRVSRPSSPNLKLVGGWTDHLKAPGFNLFYADIEADVRARIATLLGRSDFPTAAPPITKSIAVVDSPVKRPR